MHLVELGLRCNNACRFCAQGKFSEAEPAGSFEVLAARVDAAPLDETLAFVGGEPTLFEGLADLVARARSRGFSRIILQTNARRLAVEGVADALAASGVTSLDVSLHGDSEALHDYHTTVPGSFRQTALGMRRARAARLGLGTSVVVTRSNYRHLSGIVRVARTLGAQAVQVVLARPLGAARESVARVVPNARMVWPHVVRARELARTLGAVFAAPDFEPISEQGLEQWFAGLGLVDAGGSELVRSGLSTPDASGRAAASSSCMLDASS